MRTHIIYISAIIILLLLGYLGYRHSRIQEVTIEAYTAYNDSLTISINKKGYEVASRDAIIISKEKDFLKLESRNNEMLEELQSMVKGIKGRVQYAAIIETITKSSQTVPTFRDTVAAIVVYSGSYSDEWMEWTGRADRDSFHVDVKVTNRYEYAQVHRNPIFGKSRTDVQVTNLNPNTKTKELISVDVQTPNDIISFGPQMTYGVNVDRWKPEMVLGVGIQLRVGGFKK